MKLDEIFNKTLAPDAALAKCLKNMPAIWLDGICQRLGIEKAPQRREREQQIADGMLNSVELVAQMVGELEGPALALLGFLTYKDGWCPLAVLNQAATGPQGEHFDWPQHGTLTPVGELFCRGLAMAGQMKLDGDSQRILLIPEDLRAAVQDALEARLVAETGGDDGTVATQSTEPGFSSQEDLILKLVSGCLYFYGAVHIPDLYKLIRDMEPLDLDLDVFHALVRNYAQGKDGALLVGYENGIAYYKDLDDYESVFTEQRQRASLPYRPLTREEALASVDGDNERLWTDKTRALYSWMVERWPESAEGLSNKEAARAALSEIFNAIRRDLPPDEITRMLFEALNLQDNDAANAATVLLMEMWNDVPMWGLKGWSAADVRQRSAGSEAQPSINEDTQPTPMPQRLKTAEGKKLGRNDPCPCGSGNKYKRCCGRDI